MLSSLNKTTLRRYLPALLIFLLSAWLLRDYFLSRTQLILALLVAPFVFRIQAPQVYSNRYGYAAIGFLLGYCFLHMQAMLLFSCGCLLFFSIERRVGKIGFLPFLFLLLISPALHYAVSAWTFSLRLSLSAWASVLLNKAGMAVQNMGSYFILEDGARFSVDMACVGLHLINTGLCLILLLVGFAQKKSGKDLSLPKLALIFSCSLPLLILTNLLRILVLVMARSQPGTFGHDALGLATLLLYTILPMYFLIRFLIRKERPAQVLTPAQASPSAFRTRVSILSLGLLLVLAQLEVQASIRNSIRDEKLMYLNLPGFQKCFAEDGVAEYRKEDLLIYIKPACKPYESDHPPALCWQSSGFQLEEIQEVQLEGYTVLRAILKRDSLVQYTAWWYDNGSSKTVSPLKWRFEAGEPYRIINITAPSISKLEAVCRLFLKQKLF